MTGKKILLTILVILVGIGGFAAGLYLLRQNQELREFASVPDGVAEVSILPASGSFDVGDTIVSEVYFHTANIAINGIAVSIEYPFSGVTPEVSVSNITVNPTLLAGGDWNCPTSSASESGGVVNIEIACAIISSSGFTSGTDTLLATVEFQVNRDPATNPVVMRFNQGESRITALANGQDILLVPLGTGSYTIGEAVPTSIPTAAVSPTAGLSLSPTVTSALTASPTATKVPTTTSTDSATLPDAGFGAPTIGFIVIGLLAIFGSLMLAL